MNKETVAEAYVDAKDKVLNPEALSATLLERMPTPTGWRLLILPYKGEGKTEGGIYLPDQVVEENTVSTQVGYVLKVGDLAFKDKEKFPTGAWCKPGDYVMFRANTGTRFKINGNEYRLMNDDSIEAVIADPSGIQRA